MLEKAKNRKIFYFLLFIILGFSLFINPTYAATEVFNAYSSSVDIRTSSGSSDWAPLHDATTGAGFDLGTSSKIVAIVDSYTSTNKWNTICRGGLIFDTSSLPSGITITEVVLSVYVSSTTNDFTDTIEIVDFAPASYTTISLDDYNNFGVSSFNSSSLSTFSVGYHNITLSSDSYDEISDSGYSGFGLITGKDYNDDSSWLNNKQSKLYIDSESAVNPPKLYVTYLEQNCAIDVSPTSGDSPLAVSFTDKSTGFSDGVDLVYLDYGDGNSYSGVYPGYDSTRNYIYLDAGTYNYSYRITQSGTNYYDNGTITVSGDSTVNFDVYVHALNGSVIGDATVNIWYDGGTVTDSDITDDFYGTAHFYVDPSRYVNGNVTKTGYYTSNFTYYVCPTGYCSNEQWITLYTLNETPGTGDEFGNYLVTFKNSVTGETVGYSNIEVYSDSGYTTLFYDEYSNGAGVWTGLIPMDVIYYYKYPETTGYYSQSWSYNLTSSPSYKIVNLVPKSGATSTLTPTPTVTATTITPTVTYTYNDSNLSTLNVKERMTNLLVLAGFQNAESADLIFAMIIVLGCTALMGWITLSGSGAGIGAIIGFVFSLGLGLLPIWLLIAAVFLGGIYLALKLFGGTGE